MRFQKLQCLEGDFFLLKLRFTKNLLKLVFGMAHILRLLTKPYDEGGSTSYVYYIIHQQTCEIDVTLTISIAFFFNLCTVIEQQLWKTEEVGREQAYLGQIKAMCVDLALG